MNDTPQEEKTHPAEDAANQFIWTSVTCMMGGIRAALPHVPLAILVVKISSALGAYMGQCVCVGLISTVLQVRKGCVDAFSAGIKGTPIQAPPLNDKPPLAN